MTIDILSDLHLDFYFPADNVQTDAIKSIFDPIFFDNKKRNPGDVLVIAGDLGHSNSQNMEVLKIFQQEYYKYIVCVLGNHDYYLLNNSQEKQYKRNSFNRTKEMRALINAQENMYCLDGNVVDIEGIKFGGCDSWYSGDYMRAKDKYATESEINELWRTHNNDGKYIFGIQKFDDIYKLQLPKIEAVYKECDVMITHVNPSCKERHISSSFRGQGSNTFFTFDADRFMAIGSMRYWIFGHTHNEIEYEQHGVKCICNPFGYPAESVYGDDVWIKSITLEPKEKP